MTLSTADAFARAKWRNWEEAEEGGEEDFFDFYNHDFITFFFTGIHVEYTWNKSDWFAWMWLTETLHPVHLHVCLVCRVMSRKSCIQVLKSEVPIPSFPSNSQNTLLFFRVVWGYSCDGHAWCKPCEHEVCRWAIPDFSARIPPRTPWSLNKGQTLAGLYSQPSAESGAQLTAPRACGHDAGQPN